jgi:hypothetical protein
MELSRLHQKLIAAARSTPVDPRVPFAFEKRVMARITAAAADRWSAWDRALWRLTPACATVMLCLAVCSWWSTRPASATSSLERALEQTVYAAIDLSGDQW